MNFGDRTVPASACSYQASSNSMTHLITESYGHSYKKGSHPLNSANFNDTINRYTTHGYFKPRFAEWPTGGYTRKEALHRVRNGVLDTSPQSTEWGRHGYNQSLGLGRGVRQSNLASLSERQLAEHVKRSGSVPALASRPESQSDAANSKATAEDLCMATNVQTSGTAFEPQGKYIQISDPYMWNKPPNFIPFSDRRLTRALSDFNTRRFQVPSADRTLC